MCKPEIEQDIKSSGDKLKFTLLNDFIETMKKHNENP